MGSDAISLIHRSGESWSIKTQRIIRAIINGSSSEPPDLVAVARKVHISTRTLRRHLFREGTNFREVKDQVLKGITEKYMGKPDMRIASIAAICGYKNQSGFTRAFTSWHGMSPMQYRKILVEQNREKEKQQTEKSRALWGG